MTAQQANDHRPKTTAAHRTTQYLTLKPLPNPDSIPNPTYPTSPNAETWL